MNRSCIYRVVPILYFIVVCSLGVWKLTDLAKIYSATYDEPYYCISVCNWWLHGTLTDQGELSKAIGVEGVMGRFSTKGVAQSAVKLQALPGLLFMEATGKRQWIENPLANMESLLTTLRISSLWFWIASLAALQFWCTKRHGKAAAAFATTCYAFGPNLMGFSALFTPELPMWATCMLCVMALMQYLDDPKFRWLLSTGIFAGLSFSMKFTGSLIPVMILPSLAISAFRHVIHESGESAGRAIIAFRFAKRMAAIYAILGVTFVLTNLAITGFATEPLSMLSESGADLEKYAPGPLRPMVQTMMTWPFPVDFLSFLLQAKGVQAYTVGLAVIDHVPLRILDTPSIALFLFKCPLPIILAIFARAVIRPATNRHTYHLVLIVAVFYLLTWNLPKNSQYRYSLIVSPVVLMWLSSLCSNPAGKAIACVVALALAVETWQVHPGELSYFNKAVGGARNGRHFYIDSNLDWGQGLIQFRTMLERTPEFRDITLIHLVNPTHYGLDRFDIQIVTTWDFAKLSQTENITTKYVAVSTNLCQGIDGKLFAALRRSKPVAATEDYTIMIFETPDLANPG